MVAEVAIDVTADVGPLVTGMRRGASEVDKFGKTANRVKGNLERLSDSTRRFGSQMSRTNRSTGAFGRGVQNAAFQVGDFAVQVGGGVDASRALAQQLPQLLGGFGMLGAVAGAAVAIFIPLRTAMQGLAEDGQDVSRVFGTLEPVFKSVQDAMSNMSAIALDGAELVVNNIDRILTIGATAAAFFAGKWVAGMVAARIATFSFAASLVALKTALIRTGIGALIVGAGELVFQFTRLVKAAGGFGEAIKLVGDVGAEVFDRIRRLAALLPEAFGAAGLMIEGAFTGAFASILGAFANLTQAIANGFNQLFGTNLQGIESGLADQLQTTADNLTSAGADIFSSFGTSAAEILNEPFKSLERIRDLIAEMKDENITLDSIFGNLGGEDEEGGGGKSLEEKLTEQEKRIQEHFARIKAIAEGSLSDQLGGWDNYFTSLASLTQSRNEKMLKVAKAFGAAQALIDAWQAHNAVLKDPTLPWWARIASAGQVLAAGIGAVNAIKNVNAGGGGAAVGGGAAGGAPAAANTSPRVALTLQGEMFSKSQVRDLINAINEEVEGGAIVRLA